MHYLYNQCKNDLTFWYSILSKLKLPVPETYIIHTSAKIIHLFDNVEPSKIEHLDKLIEDIDYYAQKVGYPCFLRTSHTSNKHAWKNSCYLEKKEDIPSHIFTLAEMCFLADWPLETFVVRKLLKTKTHFHAFQDMPITKEVRCFFNWENIEVIRYWPLEAFSNQTKEKDIQKKLDEMYQLEDIEKQELINLCNFLKWQLPENEWCVDFLQDENKKWYIIDMSRISQSYKNLEKNAILFNITQS